MSLNLRRKPVLLGYFLRWMLLVVLAGGNIHVAWANDPPVFIRGSAEPATVNVGESICFGSFWTDPGDFIVEVQVQYCQQGTSVCETATLNFIAGADESEVGFELSVPMTQAGVFEYQFRARDELPLDTPIHTYNDGSITWQGSSTFTVTDGSTMPPVTPPTTPPISGDPVTPPPTQGGIDCLPAECEILVTFLSSLGLSGNPCTWEGIYCSGDGHVEGISSFDKTNLTGDISTLVGLTNLRYINLWNTQVTGNLSSLAGLTKLESIHLWGTQVTGNLSSLAGLTNLTSISLDKTQVTGNLSSLAGLTKLESIHLWGTQVTGNFSSLEGLTSLSSISLLNTQVTGKLSNLSNLTNLKWFSLGSDGNDQVTDNPLDLIAGDISDLAGLTSLESIVLGNLQITGNLSSLKGLTQLQSINIFDSQIEGDLSGLAGLTNLNHLMLSDNQLTGEIMLSVTTLPLGYLGLNGNCLTASDPTVIAFLDEKDPGWKETQKCANSVVDSTPPSITISEPGSSIFSTQETSISIAGSATDNVEVVRVSWATNHGGNGEAIGMTMSDGSTSWRVNNLALQEGENIITVVAYDAAGLYGSANLTVNKALSPQPKVNNLKLTPEVVTCGSFDPQSGRVIDETCVVGLSNNGDTAITIGQIFLTGEDASDYQIVSIADHPVPAMAFTLPPYYTTQIKLKLSPQKSPNGASYDAELVVMEQGSMLTAKATIKSALFSFSLKVFDASAKIFRIDESGKPFTVSFFSRSNTFPFVEVNEESEVTEKSLMNIGDTNIREGFVADGNARLLLQVRTFATKGNIIFKLPNDATSRLYPLSNSSNDDAKGQRELTVPITIVNSDNNQGQATAILRAPERFPGDANTAEVSFTVEACLANTVPEECVSQNLRICRAPVVLIHETLCEIVKNKKIT